MSSDEWSRELRSHYRDDRNLTRRQSLFSYATATTGSVEQIIVPLVASGLVLDVGCGNGLWPERLVQHGSRATFVGADTSMGMAQIAYQRPAMTAVTEADICALPFADSSFDLVLALWMLYHVPDKSTAMAELDRVKKREAYVVAVTNGSADTRLHELVAAALSTALGRSIDTFLPPLDFTSENGTTIMRAQFAECRQVDWETRFEIPTADPIVDYVESIRDPIELLVGAVDWKATREFLRVEAGRQIRKEGSVHHRTRHSAFIAR